MRAGSPIKDLLMTPDDHGQTGYPEVILQSSEKSAFYETVTGVNICFCFSLSFVFRFGCDACCSPPGFYSHFA